MKTFFTADTHFGHANIIPYCGRPWLQPNDFVDGKWSSISIKHQRAAEMTEVLIINWNNTVGEDDIVYHLGDFTFGGTNSVINLLRRLNGKIYFIWGNHDQAVKDFVKLQRFYPDLIDKISFLGEQKLVIVNGQKIVLNHYALRVWENSHGGTWHLYGHSHGSLTDDPHSRSFDVGVDCHNFRPISFDEVKAIIDAKLWQPIDHHGAKAGGGIGLTREEYARAQRLTLYHQLQKEFETCPKCGQSDAMVNGICHHTHRQ